MPEEPEKPEIGEVDRDDQPVTPRSTWRDDQKNHGYYYDDAHGYEIYKPDDKEDDLEGTTSLPNC
ncbi:MAG: hypothetical protein WKF34_10920 [Pyrinomonadaceae bacterium]